MGKVICQICGKESSRLYGAHLKSHGITSEEYKLKYPDAPLCSDEDSKNTSKNSGLHMKDEKYRKMFAEKIKGDKNPNAKSKTTEEERKKRSPFSKNFIKYENENQALDFSRKVNDSIPDEKRVTKLQYYVNKGCSYEQAKKELIKRQSTFSLDKCIEKDGEAEGRKRWLDRQEKWCINYKKSNFSKISQTLFWEIYNRLHNKEEIYFATLRNGLKDNSGKNNEFRLKLENILVLPDFFMKNKSKIIEFDGVYYHRNNPENKKRSLTRDIEIIKEGYAIFHVSEDDFKTNKEKVIEECITFITN
jgi:very-short-patch-repair endonuclease